MQRRFLPVPRRGRPGEAAEQQGATNSRPTVSDTLRLLPQPPPISFLPPAILPPTSHPLIITRLSAPR